MSTQLDTAQPRDSIGRFGAKPQTAPELSLSKAINSPVTGGYLTNLAIALEDGELFELDAQDSGIAEWDGPEGSTTPIRAGDTFKFYREGDSVKVTFTAGDLEDEEEAVRTAMAELGEAEGQDLLLRIRRAITVASEGTADLIVTDDTFEVRHVSRHPVGEDGSFYTANIVGALESDAGYQYVTRGGHVAAIWAHLD